MPPPPGTPQCCGRVLSRSSAQGPQPLPQEVGPVGGQLGLVHCVHVRRVLLEDLNLGNIMSTCTQSTLIVLCVHLGSSGWGGAPGLGSGGWGAPLVLDLVTGGCPWSWIWWLEEGGHPALVLVHSQVAGGLTRECPCPQYQITQTWMANNLPDFLGKGLWPLSSPNFNILHYYARGPSHNTEVSLKRSLGAGQG